jgi:hypothetical protein
MNDQESGAYRDKISQAVMKAIMDASMVEIDGRRTSYLMATEICDALLYVLAELTGPSPSVATTKGLKSTVDAFSRKLRARILAAQNDHTQAGRAPLSSIVINPS